MQKMELFEATFILNTPKQISPIELCHHDSTIPESTLPKKSYHSQITPEMPQVKKLPKRRKN